MNFGPHTIVITEEERQAILLAMAHLAVERPGWKYMLSETAKKLDTIQGQMSVKDLHMKALTGKFSDIKVDAGKPIMFERFRIMHQDQTSAIMTNVKAIVTAAAALEPLLPAIRRTAVHEDSSAPSPGAPQG